MAIFFLHFTQVAHIPQNTHFTFQILKICGSEAIQLRLVETDTRSCLGCFAVTEPVKFSTESVGPSYVKKFR